MARSALLILALLVGSCVQFTDAVNTDVQNNEPSEETESYMPILCSPTPGTLSSPSSVHSLRPVDISAVYALGIPPSHRREASGVVNRVAELLSMFNPEVIAPHVDQTSSQPRTLLKEAEELSLSLSHQATDWKLVLLFVPADSICASSPDFTADVNAVVEEVEAALELLQQRLQNTLVHVAVWSKIHEQDKKCGCLKDEGINQRLHKAILLKTLQDSLSHVVENPKSERPDFTAVMQSVPVILEQTLDSENTRFDPNQLAVQLWTNLLQPSTGGAEVTKSSVINIPCPSQERPFLQTQKNSPMERHVSKSTQGAFNMGTDIHCTDRNPSNTIPTSVHEVKPADIKVVAAVGDSLTAANGVGAKNPNNLLAVLNQYRGLSWSIGGDENITTVTTLPNILREFNPSLTGFSEGISGESDPKSSLNQAVPGAKCGDMEQQVRTLVDLMKKENSSIDFENDWKVITMFIGGNDICDFCEDTAFFSPRNVVLRIQNALDILHKMVPRAIVNLVELLDIVPLRELHADKSLGCPTWIVNIICPCVLKPKEGSIELQRLKDFNMEYQRGMRDLVDSGRYETREDFSVVLQPFMREIYLPRAEDGRPDRSYFSPDCFHLSQKAHTLMAIGLWNSMLEPVGNKTTFQNFEAGLDLMCPSETSPFLRTAANSDYTFPGPTPDPGPTNWGSDFSCTTTAPSSSVPTSAHKVRPADIQVVAGLGDSLTAAFGARAENLLQLRNEYRGVSWSIGGDETLENVTTLPNILKKFNPNIKGMSFGVGKANAGFNVAVSGAKAAGIPGQVRRLIDLMKNDTTVDFENDWKLVTLFIGGNDLCQYCNDRAAMSPERYTYHMMTALDMLHKEVPRTIVSILEILEIEGLRRIQRNSLGCNLLRPFLCPCFLNVGENSPEMAEVKRVNRELQVETERLAYGGRYDGKEDFAVVVQPFFKNTIVPLNADGTPDDTYFSEDCFHFSERGHAEMATAMWNNMLEPVGKKQIYNNFTNSRNNIKCPTEEHPYIFTKVNSFSTSATIAPPTPETPTIAPPTPETPTITPPTPETPTITPPKPETPPTLVTKAPPETTDNVPVWVPIVVAIAGVLVGAFATWLLFFCIAKRSKKQKMSEMRASEF